MTRKLLSLLLILFASLAQGAEDTLWYRLPEAETSSKGLFPTRLASLQRPRLALALSGGGSRGFAHIGAIKALEEAGLPIDGIAGTSIGAVVGGLYAAGYSIQELEEMARAIDWGDIFQDTPTRKSLPLSSKSSESNALLEIQFTGVRPTIPPALSAGQKLAAFLVDKVNRAPYRGEPNFDCLRIPFRAVSVDLRTGDRVLFSRGDLSEALLASMALPLLIAPLQRDGQLLIDGGIAENIPVRAAQELGDVVIAVNATQPPVLGAPPYEPWVIANQVTSLMQRALYNDLIREADVVITPLADSLGNLSFANVHTLMEEGYKATWRQIPAIRKLLADRPWDGDSSEAPSGDVRLKTTRPEEHLQDIETRFFRQSATYAACQRGQPPQKRQIFTDLEYLIRERRIQDAWAVSVGDTLTFTLQPQPVLATVEIIGVSQLSAESLRVEILKEEGKPIDETLLNRQLEDILKAYRRLGNPLARIEQVEVGKEGHLKLVVNEGVVREVRTAGRQHVSQGRIRRDFRIKTGKPLELSAVNLGVEELYGSGLFNTVRATVVGDTVAIKVVENPLPRLKLGAGVDTERQGRGFGELAYAALPGIGGSATARAKYAELDEHYSVTYSNLAIFQTYLEGVISGVSTHTEYYHYTPAGEKLGRYYFDRVGGSVHLGEQFRTWGRVLLGVRAERLRSNYGAENIELDLRRVFLRSEIDTQDRAEFPSSGRHYEVQFEAAMPALGGDVSFNRMEFQLKNVQSLTHRVALLLRLQGGLCDQATPFSEWFRLGGEATFWGLHEGEKAGRQLINLRLEVREDLISRFLADAYFSLGADVGAIWEEVDADVSLQDLLSGMGGSLILDTFLGPMSVTYGQLFESEHHPPRHQWYFNLGHRF